MGISRQLRFRLLTVMILVALAGGFFGWVAHERRMRVAMLVAQLQQNEVRVAWAQQMETRGYVSKANLTKALNDRERVWAKLSQLGALPKTP